MKLEEFATALSLPENIRTFMASYEWDNAEKCYSGRIEALEDAFILTQLSKLRKPEDPEPLLQTAALARNNELAKHCFHYLCYYLWESAKPLSRVSLLPEFTMIPGFETVGEVLTLLAALSVIPYVEKSYAKLGLPPEYALDTIQYISGGIEEHRAGFDGRPGFGAAPDKLNWMRHYIDGELFRIDRLEYMIQDPHPWLPAAYRNKADGKVIALCRNGWTLNQNGLRLWDDEPPSNAYCTAKLESDAKSVTGIPINPRGFAEVEQTLTLDLAKFEPLWQQWDLMPGVHIPGGGGMTPDACRTSFQEALEFFPKYFHRRVVGFSCVSWVFNPDFERILPESNLAKLMREVYLFPTPSVGVEGLVFVFGKESNDWSNFPADNTLRRAFHQLRREGRRLKAGGMFIDANAVQNFGTQRFR